jgi:hypothetical protein
LIVVIIVLVLVIVVLLHFVFIVVDVLNSSLLSLALCGCVVGAFSDCGSGVFRELVVFDRKA